MDAGVEVAGAELPVVGFGLPTEGVEAQQPLGVAGAAALVEEFLDVIGVLEVTVAFVAAGMGGDEIVTIDAPEGGQEFSRNAKEAKKCRRPTALRTYAGGPMAEKSPAG